jgi:hypothetical protein
LAGLAILRVKVKGLFVRPPSLQLNSNIAKPFLQLAIILIPVVLDTVVLYSDTRLAFGIVTCAFELHLRFSRVEGGTRTVELRIHIERMVSGRVGDKGTTHPWIVTAREATRIEIALRFRLPAVVPVPADSGEAVVAGGKADEEERKQEAQHEAEMDARHSDHVISSWAMKK